MYSVGIGGQILVCMQAHDKVTINESYLSHRRLISPVCLVFHTLCVLPVLPSLACDFFSLYFLVIVGYKSK